MVLAEDKGFPLGLRAGGRALEAEVEAPPAQSLLQKEESCANLLVWGVCVCQPCSRKD